MSSVSTIAVRLRQKLCPVRGDSALSGIKRHASSLYLFRQIILHTIFDLEVTVVERRRIRSAFRPDISQSICSSKLEGYQMIQFAHLVFTGICARLPCPVPLVGDVLLSFAHLAVADARRSPSRIPQNLSRDRSIDTSRRTAGIGNRIAIAHLRSAHILSRRLPLVKVARVALNSERAAGHRFQFAASPFSAMLLLVTIETWLGVRRCCR